MTIPQSVDIAQDTPPGRRPRLALAVVCLCQLMVVLDMTVVNVALPSIRTDLGFSANSLQWVVNAYSLTFGGLLLLGGRLADLFGQRRAAIGGLLLFAITSLLGGIAQNPGQLIAARAVQGIAGAVLLPVSLTVITTTFAEGHARNRALATWGAVGGAGGAIGVLLGGVLTEYLDWRWVLFVNLPIAALAIPMVLRSIPTTAKGPRPRLDVAGAVLITAAMVALVYAVVRTDTYAWASPQTIGVLLLAAVLTAAFVLVEQRLAAAPLMRLGILRNRGLLIASIVIFFVVSGQFAAFYFASLYLQGVLHYSPVQTGLAFVPFSLGVVIGSMTGAKVMARIGARPPLVAGLALAAIGMAWFGAISVNGTFVGTILGPSLVASVGLGLCFVANTSAATAGIAHDEAGLASGLLNTFRQCGGSIGLAVLVTIANGVTSRQASTGVETIHALTTGYSRAFLIGGCLIAAAAIVAALFLPANTKRTTPESDG